MSKPTPAEACRFVASQLSTLGYPAYADRIRELIVENERLERLINTRPGVDPQTKLKGA
jgi:hypothetical protein